MAIDTLPGWLLHWLKIPFYEETCTKHEGKYLTNYCISCMLPPVCDTCWSSHHKKLHLKDRCRILRTRRASERTAVKPGEIQEFWDASQVQTYIINQKPIYHLKPNPKSCGESSSSSSQVRCQTCSRKLMDSKFSFCSIACKVESILDGRRVGGGQMQIEENAVDSGPRVVRRRARKGIPHRAPLY